MKTKGKVLLVSICGAMLVSAGIAGTLAYFTDTEAVTNTFTVGDIDIVLDEAKVTTAGVLVTGTDAGRTEDGNAYHLLPGHKYVKDPTVHVQAKSEDCYVFVKVENHLTDAECNGKVGENEKPCLHKDCSTIAEQMAANGWIALGDDHANVYVHGTVKNGVITPAVVSRNDNGVQDLKVFDNFWIDGDIDNDTLATYATAKNDAGEVTGNTVNVTAYAVQADGFTSAQEAWETAICEETHA